MRAKPLLVACSVAIATLPAGGVKAALAQSNCGERSELLEILYRDYGEIPAAAGLANDHAMIELVKRPDGKSWTIIVSMPSGKSCMLASGEGWQEKKPEVSDGPPAL